MIENRKFIIIGVFCLVGLIYAARLLYLQILDDSYSLESSSNSIKRIIEVPYRGQIYDRSGNVLVYNTPVYDLYVTPKRVKIADTTAFCRMMDLTIPEFDSIMNVAKAYSYVKPSIFLRQLTKEDYARIQDAMIDYRGFEPMISSMRTYPAHTLSNALGYVSEITRKQLDNQETPYYRQGDYVGHNGLEESYEPELRGRRGIKYVMQNVRGVAKGSFKDGEFDTAAVAGKSLYTAIDLAVQKFADSLMVNKVGAILAIDPSTGEILASVSAPTYDPNELSSRFFSKNYRKLIKNPYKPLINRPIMASYRPGSTFKLIQALIAQQQGSLVASMVYGHGGVPVRCHCHGGNNLRGAIQFSCNPYFYHVFRKYIYNNGNPNTFKASAIGLQEWHDHAKKFGIGQKLGVDLPSERIGNLPSVDTYDKAYRGELRWKFSNIYSLSIGEGELLASPLKLANLAATIANRGWYIDPHYVKGIGKLGEGIPDNFKEKHYTDIDQPYFQPVIEGMRLAVSAGTVKREANIPGIDLCGKTGTAQNAKFGHAHDHSIFIGFAPMNNPKIAIAVFVENAGWGGEAAASVAALVAERYIKGKTEAQGQKLREWLMKQNYMPPLFMLPGASKPAPPARRPQAPVKDTIRKPRLMMTRNQDTVKNTVAGN